MALRVVHPAQRQREADVLELVGRVLSGDRAAFEPLMRRYNRRLFRSARSIVKSDTEAEDVVQQTYLTAFAKLEQFAEDSSFATWLTRIAINEGLARRRAQRQRRELVRLRDHPGWWRGHGETPADNPEEHASKRELGQVLEQAIDDLPDGLRLALVLREVDGLSVSETAECLLLSPEATRVRVHRARRLVQERLLASLRGVFAFDGERCHRVVATVLVQLGV